MVHITTRGTCINRFFVRTTNKATFYYTYYYMHGISPKLAIVNNKPLVTMQQMMTSRIWSARVILLVHWRKQYETKDEKQQQQRQLRFSGPGQGVGLFDLNKLTIPKLSRFTV